MGALSTTITSAPLARASGRSWYAVAALTVAYVISFIDRQVVSLLVEPIKADLHLSDMQISLIQGLSFALFYTLLGLPIGRLADSVNRRNLVIAGIGLWSLMTAICGLARSFGQLFFARMGVGVGEATLSPAAYAMIADSFPQRQLSFAISVYSLGGFIGIGMALLVGGALVDLSTRIGEVVLLGHRFAGWQMIFLLLSALGPVGIAAMIGVREPRRRGADTVLGASVSTTARYLQAHAATFVPMLTAFACFILMSSGIAAWAPTILIRIYGWSAAEAGYGLGLVALPSSVIGVLLYGALCDRASGHGVDDATLVASLIGTAGMFCAMLSLLWVDSGDGVLVCVAVAYFFLAPLGIAPAAVQLLSPGNMRSQLSAVYVSSTNLLGLALGPSAVALITDFAFADEQKVQVSLAITGIVAMPIAALLLLAARAPFRRTFEANRPTEDFA